MSSSFDFAIKGLAGRRAISAGIFASFVARQKKARGSASPDSSENPFA